jgi:glycosyltransferase involved in cell wall biosynthesis
VKAAHVYATYVSTRREGITNNIEGLCESLRRRRIDVRLDAPRVRLRDLNRRSTHIVKGWESSRLLGSAFDDPGVEVVHHHVSIAAMGVWGRLAKMRRARVRKPLIAHVWNAVYRPQDTFGTPPRSELTYHRVFNNPRMAARGLKGADAIVVSSRFQEAQLGEADVKAPIHVIPNGVDTRAFKPATAQERDAARLELGLDGDLTMLYFGHLSPWKGVDHFVDALPMVFQQTPRAQAVIAHTSYGNGEPRLRQRLARLGIEDRVLVRGPSHVPTLLAAADLAVVPAMAAVGSACHPNVLLELLAAGIPVVASRVGSIPEAVVDGVTGYLTRPGDPEDIAAHLNLLGDDDALRRRAGASARREVVESFDWDVVAERVNALYQRLGESAPGGPLASPSEAKDAEKITA